MVIKVLLENEYKSLNRIWRTTVNGTPGTVNVSIDLTELGLPLNLAASKYALLIDGDDNFTNAATIHTAGATLSGTILSFTGVTFNDGDHFTFAIDGSSYTGPAGLNNNIALWLKADAGIAGTVPVTGWNDQSGNGKNAVKVVVSLVL